MKGTPRHLALCESKPFYNVPVIIIMKIIIIIKVPQSLCTYMKPDDVGGELVHYEPFNINTDV